LLVTGQFDLYFQKVNGETMSSHFKELVLALFSHDPETRPTINQIRAHPWMNKSGFNIEETKHALINDLKLKKTPVQTARTNTQAENKPVRVRKTTVHY